MSKRSMAKMVGFETVARISEVTTNISNTSNNANTSSSGNNATNVADDSSINDNDVAAANVGNSVIDSLIGPEKEKPHYTGVYLDADIAVVLNGIVEKSGKKGSKSIKSKIVNEALRKFLREAGLLEEGK